MSLQSMRALITNLQIEVWRTCEELQQQQSHTAVESHNHASKCSTSHKQPVPAHRVSFALPWKRSEDQVVAIYALIVLTQLYEVC
jgi:hypothetical protein